MLPWLLNSSPSIRSTRDKRALEAPILDRLALHTGLLSLHRERENTADLAPMLITAGRSPIPTPSGTTRLSWYKPTEPGLSLQTARLHPRAVGSAVPSTDSSKP